MPRLSNADGAIAPAVVAEKLDSPENVTPRDGMSPAKTGAWNSARVLRSRL